MSDVPLGMFLSGGIDSSAIAALMAREIDRPLQTFSVAFDDRAFSELEYAREVARAIGADAHEVVIDDRDFFGALPRLVWHEDEPIAHPSSVPLYFVSALARAARHGRADRRRQRRAARRLRQVPARRSGTGAPAASTSGWCPRALRAGVARGCRAAAAGRARALRAPVVPGDGPRRRQSMFLDNFAAIRSPTSAQLLAPALRATATPRTPTARRWPTSTRRTAAARCSIGCSTPTSRPTWSSC